MSFREVSIHAAVEQHFKDIEHDPTVQDVTYENSQARERTQILMDLANQAGGFCHRHGRPVGAGARLGYL